MASLLNKNIFELIIDSPV